MGKHIDVCINPYPDGSNLLVHCNGGSFLKAIDFHVDREPSESRRRRGGRLGTGSLLSRTRDAGSSRPAESNSTKDTSEVVTKAQNQYVPPG